MYTAASLASIIVFAWTAKIIWDKAERFTVLQVTAFSPMLYLVFGTFLDQWPHAEGKFRADDPDVVMNMFVAASAVAGLFLIVQAAYVRPLKSHQRGVKAKGLRYGVIGAAVVTAGLLATAPLDLGLVAGADRAAFRASSPVLVALLGYFFPLSAVVFAWANRTVNNRWTYLCLAISACSVLIGFRGLLLTAVISAGIAGLHVGDRISLKAVRRSLGGATVLLLGLTALRPEADSGIYGALANRVFYTSVYQIEKAGQLTDTQGYPGQWLVAEFLSRLGGDVVTLQQAVWRLDFPNSKFVGGSYPVIGDLVGNFGREWWVVYTLVLLVVWLWDVAGIHAVERQGGLLNDLLLVIATRVAFFGLSAAITPLAFVAIGSAVVVRRTRKREELVDSDDPGPLDLTDTNVTEIDSVRSEVIELRDPIDRVGAPASGAPANRGQKTPVKKSEKSIFF